MNNFEKAETEYNKNYDPCAEKCPHCGAEDSFENFRFYYGEENIILFCIECGCEVENE